MTQARRALGERGEQLAVEHLERRGYAILARNVRRDGVELDIVARQGRTLVFVEVKTRRGRWQGSGLLAVDAPKRRRLVRGAFAWLAVERRRAPRVRFDVIAIECQRDGRFRLHHVERAFDAGD